MSPLANRPIFKMVLAILRCLSFVPRLVSWFVCLLCRVLLARRFSSRCAAVGSFWSGGLCCVLVFGLAVCFFVRAVLLVVAFCLDDR